MISEIEFIEEMNKNYTKIKREYLDIMTRKTLYHLIITFMYNNDIYDYEEFLKEILEHQESVKNP